MVEMDSWCPSCGYSVEPGTRFCGGCGYQLGPAGDASSTGSSTVTMQAPEPFHGYPPPAATGGFRPPAVPLSAPPPSGSPLPWPPPPVPGSQAPSGFAAPPSMAAPATVQPATGQPTTVQPPVSDTMDRMLRPQGLFQNSQQLPPGWQHPQAPVPGAYPPGGQYPQGAPYPPPGYPQGGQYPPTGGFQQAPPPQAWGPAPTGAIPVAPTGGIPALPPGYPADGQYPQGAPAGGGYQYPYGQVQYGQEGFPPGTFGPGVQYGPDGMPLGGGGQPGLRSRLPVRLPRGRLIPLAVAGVVALVVIVALTLATLGGSSSNKNGAGVAGTPTATTSGTSALTQQQAATALSGLLAQSGADHSDVNAAVGNVEACGKGLSHDAQVLSTAASNRHALLTKLAQLPGHAELPPAMVSDLTTAWQASATVDADLAKWAADAASHCRKGNLNDPNYTATIPFDSKATNGKIAFVKLWNPLAKKDGLPTYQSAQL
jgi:hypothetical protein